MNNTKKTTPKTNTQEFVTKRKNGKALSATVTHLGYVMDEVRSAIQKSIRRGDEQQACWWAYQAIRHGWCEYLWTVFRIIASEDIGIAAPNVAVQVNALAINADKGTGGFKKEMFVGLAEMQAVIILCHAPKCWTATHALMSCQKVRRQVELGDVDLPVVPPYARDCHTAAGRARGAKKSDFWREGRSLSPRGTSHFENGPDAAPFASIHGDDDVL